MRICIFICVLLSSISYGQKKDESADISFLKVKYNFKFLSDTLDPNSEKEEEMTLLIGKSSSLFFSQQKYVSDSLNNLSISNSIAIAKRGSGVVNIDLRNIPKYYVAHEVYKNDSILIFNRLDKNYFSFKPTHEILWKLEDATMVISGQVCHKAVGTYNGRIYEAWYSPNINIPDGPYVFKGLPGLVFKIADVNRYNSFNLASLEKDNHPIKPVPKSENTTRQRFRAARQAFIYTTSDRLKGHIYRELTVDELKKIESIRKSAPNNYLD